MPNSIRVRAIQGLKQGDSFMYTRDFTEAETQAFGDLTRDYNPVHYDSRWTGLKGFDGLICHGLLVGSMICEFGGQVGWLATGMKFKYIKPVYFGDTVHCTITITRIETSGRAEGRGFFYQPGWHASMLCAYDRTSAAGTRTGASRTNGRRKRPDQQTV